MKIKKLGMVLWSTILSMSLFSMSVAADIYRWKDANGRVIYSQTPPSDQKKVTLTKPIVDANSNQTNANTTQTGKAENSTNALIPPTASMNDQKAAMMKTDEPNAQLAAEQTKTLSPEAAAKEQQKHYQSYVATYVMLLDRDQMAELKIKKLPKAKDEKNKEDAGNKDEQGLEWWKKDEETQAKIKSACLDARKNVDSLELSITTGAAVQIEENGNKRVLTPEEVQEEKKNSVAIADFYCSKLE